MITKFLTTNFIKNNDKIHDKEVREQYGRLSGIIGIIINLILFTVELTLGIFSNSIAMIADAFHDLADVTSSIVTLIGFKLASKPADKEHPFGHGRIEYISALIVSFIIILIGYEFIRSSFDRILHPEAVHFSITSLIIILIAIPLKLWLSHFNKTIGKKIQSSTIVATGVDALNDVAILIGVILSLLISQFLHVTVDGYIGAIVAIFIIFSGVSFIKDTIDPLLGKVPDPYLVKEISKSIMSYDYILGIHDLIIHDYGPGRCMASLHAEVPSNVSIVDIHDVIDKAEKDLSEKLNIFVVIHMDPICEDSGEVGELKGMIAEILKNFPLIHSFHDFRIVGEGENRNLIFDIVLSQDFDFTEISEHKLKEDIDTRIKSIHPNFNSKITIDRDFIN
jgi:cation diffusion facilitator family transporter